MVYSDCHAHLDLFSPKEADGMVEEASELGVELVVAASLNAESSRKTLEMSKRYGEMVFPAVGIHPRIVHSVDKSEVDEILDLARLEEVAAISEVGLDYRKRPGTRKRQVDVFRRFLEVGAETDKPLIVHVLDAFDDVIRLIGERSGVRGAIHCFSGTLEQAQVLADLNFYPSICNGVLTDPHPRLQEVVDGLALDHMVIDTDALPWTFEIRHAADIAGVVAERRGLASGTVGNVITKNVRRLLS